MGIAPYFSSTIPDETSRPLRNQIPTMTTALKIAALLALPLFFATGCQGDEDPAQTLADGSAVDATVFEQNDDPLPPDEVFFPEASLDGSELLFRVQMLPGYYLYKDKIEIRSLTEGVELGEPEFLTTSDTVTDQWFGEQEIFYIEAAATTPVIPDEPEFLVELSYQGCKVDDICYLPVSREIAIEQDAQVESAANPFETR